MKPRLLFVDHYDSFSYNLVSALRSLSADVTVVESNLLKIKLINEANLIYDGLVFSPGPKSPQDYPNSISLYKNLPSDFPVLGVCLGHQLMLTASGAALHQISNIPVHGQRMNLNIDSLHCAPHGPFTGTAIFYNSLGVPKNDPIFNEWICRASVDNICIIAEHIEKKHLGLQFHPESFASTIGIPILESFLIHSFGR